MSFATHVLIILPLKSAGICVLRLSLPILRNTVQLREEFQTDPNMIQKLVLGKRAYKGRIPAQGVRGKTSRGLKHMLPESTVSGARQNCLWRGKAWSLRVTQRHVDKRARVAGI